MDIKDLDQTEQLALMGLLRLTVSADAEMSSEESAALLEIADTMGRAAFIEARKRAQAQLSSHDDIKRAVAAVERDEARALIYNLTVGVAAGDNIVSSEAEVLRWAADTWGISIDDETLRPT